MKRNGIDFFPYPSLNNSALQLLEAKYKLKGIGVYVKLLQKIFSDEGYFYKISDDVILLLKQELNLQPADNIIQDVIDECIARELFDKSKYVKYSILTSEEIQKEYLNAVRKRKNVDLVKNYLLPFATKFLKMAEKKQKTAEEIKKTAEDLDKGKESKGKENNINNTKEGDYTNIVTNTAPDFPSLIKKFEDATGKYTKDVKVLPIGIDMELLINKVKASDFLMRANNMSLKHCLLNYDKIISGFYDNDKPTAQKVNLIHEHKYTTEELNSFFTNIDDIKFD